MRSSEGHCAPATRQGIGIGVGEQERLRRHLPPCQTGPTVWITWRAGSSIAAGDLGFAGFAQPPSVRHSASSSGPAARWIAPSTPPPPSRVLVGGVNDGIDIERGDVGDDDLDAVRHGVVEAAGTCDRSMLSPMRCSTPRDNAVRPPWRISVPRCYKSNDPILPATPFRPPSTITTVASTRRWTRARKAFEDKGLQAYALAPAVFREIAAASHRAIGAYEVLDRLAAQRRAAGADLGLSRHRHAGGGRHRAPLRKPQRLLCLPCRP